MKSQIVVTGLGVASSIGMGASAYEASLFSGGSSIKEVQFRIGTSDLMIPAAVVPDFQVPQVVSSPRPDRVIQLGVCAASEAVKHAMINQENLANDRVGIFVGCAFGGANSGEDGYRAVYQDGRSRVRPTTVPSVMPSALAAELSIRWGIEGPQFTYSVACASSALAIGEAGRALESGLIDVAIAGGSESMITPAVAAAWKAMGVMAGTDTLPEQSCRPFSLDRTGLVLGEGSAFMILETSEGCTRRGAKPLAILAGYGRSSDARSLTAPDAPGQVRAMRAAMADAKVLPGAIGYLNAHATGTKAGDEIEATAIRQVFGADWARIAVSSTKALHGHGLGAAGALEGAAALLALRRRQSIPAYFVRAKDESCLLLLAAGEDFLASQNAVMSNSFAFGGVNVSLIFCLPA
jgi:3-oxoacyl-[acyl-carrier-protein] synthase II